MKKSEAFSILDTGVSFEGTLSANGKILINGIVKGTLNGELITIGETGTVYADTKAQNLTIGGIFEGKAETSNQLIIRSSGCCKGEIICKDLVVEPGGVLNGQVTRTAVGEIKETE